MSNCKLSAKNLTDEEVLDEFVKRFQCDGAVLIYYERNTEYGFGRWRNSLGRKWVSHLFKMVQQDEPFLVKNSEIEKGVAVPLSLKQETNHC